MRGLFLEKIGTVPHGRKVANRLVQLSPDFFAALAETRYMEAASEFLRTYDLVKSQLDNLTIEQCLLSCREEIAVMRKVLDLDPTGALTNINLTIGEIAERSVLMGHRDTLLRQVDASAVRDTARKWERTSELSDAIEAVQWVDALYRHAPPRHIQDLLLSGETAEIIQQFHVVASRGEELRRLYKSLVVQLCQEFPVVRLDAVAPLDLVKQTKELLTREHRAVRFSGNPTRQKRSRFSLIGCATGLGRRNEIQLDPHRICPLLDLIIADRCASRIRNSAVLSGADRYVVGRIPPPVCRTRWEKIKSDQNSRCEQNSDKDNPLEERNVTDSE